jgi:hypothetical protein
MAEVIEQMHNNSELHKKYKDARKDYTTVRDCENRIKSVAWRMCSIINYDSVL